MAPFWSALRPGPLPGTGAGGLLLSTLVQPHFLVHRKEEITSTWGNPMGPEGPWETPAPLAT